MKTYTMNLRAATDLGKQFAVDGWDEQDIGEWLIESGYSVNGMTAQRIMASYVRQQDRK